MRSLETLPAEGIGCIPVARGHREGFGDSAMCHVLRFYVFGGGHGSLLRPCRVLSVYKTI